MGDLSCDCCWFDLSYTCIFECTQHCTEILHYVSHFFVVMKLSEFINNGPLDRKNDDLCLQKILESEIDYFIVKNMGFM